MKNHKVSLSVYIKNKYKYGVYEEQLGILADKLGGRCVGGGTCLYNGKRDQQYTFESKEKAQTFLDYPTVRDVILKEYDLVEI
jgi:hypothetical protein